jgi:hypothetical protein
MDGAKRGGKYSGYLMNGEPDTQWWFGEIRKGVAYRKKSAYQAKWDRWEKYYRGEWESGIMPVNLFFKMIRTMVPRVYFRDPTVSITQTKPGDVEAVLAQLLERIDNKLIRHMKLKAQMKLAIQDSFLYGTGVLKLGFGAQYTPTPGDISTSAPEKEVRGTVYRSEWNSLVEPNMPWVMRVHPKHFIISPHATSMDEARWVAHEILMPLNELKADSRFKHTADLATSKQLSSVLDPGADGMIQLLEVRDKKTGKVFVLAPNYTQRVLLMDDDKFLQTTGRFPYYPIVFNIPSENFWGIPDAQIMDPQQREANEIRTQIMKHRRMSLIKLMALEDGISQDEIEKLTNEQVAPVVRVKAMNAVEPMAVVAQMPAGLLQADQMVGQEVQEILGLGTNQFGEYAPGSADRSATEAQIVNQATQIRMDERRDLVADTLTDIIGGVHVVIFQFWTQEQVVSIAGDEGAPIWVAVRPEMLKNGEYDVNVDPDSGLPNTVQMRTAKAMQLYPLLMQNPFTDKYKVTQYLIRELHGAGYDDLLQTQQQVQAQAQAQQQTAPVAPAQFAHQNPRTVQKRQQTHAKVA